MNKKCLKNKLNSQKGITGSDVVIAMLIILTTLGVIGAVYTNLAIGSRETERKAGVTRMAVNILENVDMLYYDEIFSKLKILSDNAIATKEGSKYIINGGSGVKVFNTSIPKGYRVEISFENPIDNTEENDFIKKLILNIKYTVDGRDKNITLSKMIEREIIRECNSPNFSEEYISQVVGDSEFIMWKENPGDSAGVKIICPIRYNKNLKKYELVDVSTNEIWYSYSNKEWARILVLDAEEYSNNIDSADNTVNNLDILKGENSYVWIPRFGIEEGGSLENALFKYKDTDLAIFNLYEEDSSSIYNYINVNNPITWSTTRGISFETEKTLGNWSKYSEISEISEIKTDADYLNNSQYGPLIQY